MLERIRYCLPAGADAEVRPMYGLEAFVCRGAMFAAPYQGDLLVRLDPDERDEALALAGSSSWSPGDYDEEYVIIPAHHVGSDEMLRYWIGKAYEYAENLSMAEALDDSGEMDMEEGMEHRFEESTIPPPAKVEKPKPAPAKAKAPAAAPKQKAAVKPAQKAKAAPKQKAAVKPAQKAKAAPKKKAAVKAAKKAKAAPKKKAARKPAKKAKAAPKKKGARKAAKKK